MTANIGGLIPELQQPCRDLLQAAGAAGLMPKITSTYRSYTEQARLYRRYQQGLQVLPVAAPGTSAHEFGYAFDMVVTPMDALSDVGYTWEQWGGVWGGEFSDPVHFEYPGFQAPVGAAVDPTRTEKTGLVETVAGLFSPGAIGVTQDILGAMQDLFPWMDQSDAIHYITHPWRGMDFLLPQWLLDWRKANLGF